MTEKYKAKPAPDAELARNVATVKRGIEAKVDEIKRELAQWIAANTASTNILNLHIYDEEEARDFIEKAFLRAVQRRRSPLQ